MKLSKLIVIMMLLALGVVVVVTYSGFDEQVASYAVNNEEAFRKAAEQGDAEAQYHLAVMYGAGVGVETDYDEALKWYSQAAEQGYAKAQYNLGMMYYFGKGVLEDKVTAYQWVILSAERGEQAALDVMPELAKKISSTQIASAQAAAQAWSQAHPADSQ